jgi:hypothetical protein
MDNFFLKVLHEEPLSDLSLNDLKGGGDCGMDHCTFDCPNLTSLCTSENALICSCNVSGSKNICMSHCPSALGPKPEIPDIDDCLNLINRP